jgi:hypothetical protein
MFDAFANPDTLRAVAFILGGLACVWLFGGLFARILRDEREAGRQEGIAEAQRGIRKPRD